MAGIPHVMNLLTWTFIHSMAAVMCRNINGVAVNNTLTIAYLWPWTHIWPVGPTTGSAIVLGLREVETRKVLF